MKSDQVDPQGELVTVGLIAKVHGIGGEVVVHPLTDDPGRFNVGETLLLEVPGAPASPRRILGSRMHQQRFLLLLEGVPDRTAAEALRGGRLCVREADLPALPAGQVWLHDLPGMAVASEDGEDLGTVRQVLETGEERRVLEVHGPRGEFLVPFIEQFVLAIDRDARRIKIRVLEGLVP
ncbi:MAG: ribosome maturation factor RimM [Candidatus Methylomirabilia bacterium]